MSTKLEQFLAEIHPSRTIEPVNLRADEAINTFAWPDGSIQTMAEFERVMTDIYHHVWFGILNLDPDLTRYDEHEFELCRRVLTSAYGDWVEAFKMVVTGARGGLYAVCQQIARRLVEEHSSNHINSAVSRFWDGLTSDELIAAASEYVDKNGYLWPPDMRDSNGLRLKVSFCQVLAQHPFRVRQLGQLGR